MLQNPFSRISKVFFKQNVCKCVKNPKHISCVDIFMSDLDHAKMALWRNVFGRSRKRAGDSCPTTGEDVGSTTATRMSICEKLTACQCPYHLQVRQDIMLIPLEDLVKFSALKIIYYSCCERFTHNDLVYMNGIATDERRKFIHL